MNGRLFAGFALLAVATLAVASAVAQVDGAAPAPAAPDAETTTAAAPDAEEPEAGEPEVAPAADVPEPSEAADAGAPTPEPDTAPSAVRDAGAAEARRVVARRREAALVGGWVSSTHDVAAFTVTVDDLLLGANGEWTRRASRVGSDQGLREPPTETSGTWFTEEGTVVLLDRGSAVDEVLRSPFLIDDRSEQLTLEVDGRPVLYYRYR